MLRRRKIVLPTQRLYGSKPAIPCLSSLLMSPSLMIFSAGGAGQEEGAAGAATAQEVGRSAGQE